MVFFCKSKPDDLYKLFKKLKKKQDYKRKSRVNMDREIKITKDLSKLKNFFFVKHEVN